jgi:vacuolar-type H+-ATPase subunit E/Vma4
VGKVLGNEEFSEAVSSHDFEQIQEDGIIVESENGERRLNLTFEKIRQDFEQNYRKDVAEMLLDQ